MRLLRTLALACSATLLAAAAVAQTSRSVAQMTLTQSDYGGGRVYLPMRFGNFLGTMRLDTGASTTRVALAPWNRDLPVIGQSYSTGATARCDAVEARNVALKAVQGNDIARAKYEATRCVSNDGDDLLGLDFFRGARFTLDFARREMTFFGDPPGARAKPLRVLGPDRRLVGLDLRLGGVAAAGLFDTGAEICAVDLAFLKAHRSLFAPVKGRKTQASEAGGRRFSSRVFRLKTLELGDGLAAHDVYVLAYDFGVLREALGPGTPFILGYNLISRFTWEIDLSAPDRPTWDARVR
jgi:hypothetical protein